MDRKAGHDSLVNVHSERDTKIGLDGHFAPDGANEPERGLSRSPITAKAAAGYCRPVRREIFILIAFVATNAGEFKPSGIRISAGWRSLSAK